MFGNDVVDLNAAELQSHWERRGFLEKIYSQSEQDLIRSSPHPGIQVWVLWSMKEAVYKAWSRLYLQKEYAPSKIQCDLLRWEGSEVSGTVHYHNSTFHTHTQVGKDFIHTTAQLGNNHNKLKSLLVRDYPVNYEVYLRDIHFMPETTVIIKDELGIPSLYDRAKRSTHPVSISHHGIFLGIIHREI